MQVLRVYDVQVFVRDVQVHDDFHIVGKVVEIYDNPNLLFVIFLLVELDHVEYLHGDAGTLRYGDLYRHALADWAFDDLALEHDAFLVFAFGCFLYVKYAHCIFP